jgi:hypothetical protein
MMGFLNILMLVTFVRKKMKKIIFYLFLIKCVAVSLISI